MLLLHTLHERGFERLRHSAGTSPSWLHWRYEIAPTASFNPNGVALKRELCARSAFSSSNSKFAPFGWKDAETATLETFADWFVQRYPAVVEAGRVRTLPTSHGTSICSR